MNSTTITATFGISSGATLSSRDVRVTSLGVQSAVNPNDTFTVQGATLTSISPNAHTRGGVGFTVTLTGTNLTGATAVNVTRPGGAVGITVSNVTPVNATTVTATFTISGTAVQSGRNVTVTTPIGNTNAVTFTIQ